MGEELKATAIGGVIPTGLPGGFFIYEADGDEQILFADMNIIAMFGCSSFKELYDYVGGSFKGMIHPDDLSKVQNLIQAQTKAVDKRHDYVRYRIIPKGGEERYVEDFGHLLHWDDGKSFYYVFIADVDENEYYNTSRNSYAEAEVLATSHATDSLTGLFNMPFFYQQVQKLLASPKGRRLDISIIHFDIPNFKTFNERYGFKVGDEILCDMAKAISDVFPEAIVSRFSDDHFVACATCERSMVINRVEEIYKRILNAKETNKRVRVKAGIYYIDDRVIEVGLACDHARLACNSIKHRHDRCYSVYDDMLRDGLRKQQYVLDHIDEAIEKEYIKVYYQPVVRVKTGEICGYEALARWIDPIIGTLSPADFIETLEQAHLIHLVDRYVIERVCKDFKALKDAGEPVVPVSLNISRLDFELCDIFGFLEDKREEYEIPRTMLDIEITESALNDNVGYIRLECDQMRNLGYKIWLDDFGSGYSSLNTLADYSFDVLKLDLVFLRNYDKNPKTRKLMEYIINGARGMGLAPLAEGVETEEHYEFLKKVGCVRAQGYFFGKPMPLDETRNYTKGKGMAWEASNN